MTRLLRKLPHQRLKYTCENKHETDSENKQTLKFRGLGEEALLACMLVDVGCGNVPFFAGFGGNLAATT